MSALIYPYGMTNVKGKKIISSYLQSRWLLMDVQTIPTAFIAGLQ